MQAPSANRSGRCVSFWDSARSSREFAPVKAPARKKFIGLEKQVAREINKLKRTTLFFLFFPPLSRTGAPINDLNLANYRVRRVTRVPVLSMPLLSPTP